VTFFAGALGAKRVELLRELMPNAYLIVMLANQTNPNAKSEMREVESAAQTLGLQLQVLTANTDGEVRRDLRRLWDTSTGRAVC
jgi:ABC-type uncharacterized transport system substrate-binding protein